jgi:hypothetical protein
VIRTQLLIPNRRVGDDAGDASKCSSCYDSLDGSSVASLNLISMGGVLGGGGGGLKIRSVLLIY